MQTTLIGLAAAVLLASLFLNVPVFISILAGSVTYFFLSGGSLTTLLGQRILSGVESIPLLAIPFFVAAGVFMNYSGVTRRIMNFCNLLIGQRTGGLAQVNVLLSTLMGGLSGSNLADAAMESKMLVPEMEKKGFSKEFSTVVTAMSSMITPLIPPGIAMILYGSVANISIGKIFIAGIGNGLLLCVAMMILVAVISKKRGYKSIEKLEVKPSQAIRGAILPLCLPVIILGGIRLGIFTATEAGSVAIVYALVLGLIYKELKIENIKTGLKETVATTASIMVIVGAASAFAWVLTRGQIPQKFTQLVIGTIHSKYVFLIVVILFLIVVGMFIEGNAALIVLVPLLAPVANAYGIDPIHFAMVYIFTMACGGVTPPVGTLIFVTCGITKCTIKDFIVESIPFYIMLFICMLLIAFCPWISTGLVNLIY
ncbi:TRAP transporter large permease [Treponema parvum]|uniref:TRAP transporter large permease n=1 Tax=Treponema parvum TaxID=138851 RepID=UPI001AEC2D85|nr:TRAP transporter large permease [Treponema parvum]QTQ16458.1 TRAP transporter large permease [Treponema parvum]